VHGSLDDFTKAQRQRRQRIVDEYLHTLTPAALRGKVVAVCAQDFADLGVVITI